MDNNLKINRDRSVRFRIIIVWLAIILLGSFWLTIAGNSGQVSISALPQVPREREPVIVIFRLNNSATQTETFRYRFYANGEIVKEGTTSILPGSSKTYKYAYDNPLPLGEQLNFVVKTESDLGNHQAIFSSPSYPPQIWSSFVSFASFSTTVMGFMSTMTYYQNTIGADMGLNVGIIISLVLIFLLVFLELSQAVTQGETTSVIRRLNARFPTVTWILYIILMGIVYTRVLMILAG